MISLIDTENEMEQFILDGIMQYQYFPDPKAVNYNNDKLELSLPVHFQRHEKRILVRKYLIFKRYQTPIYDGMLVIKNVISYSMPSKIEIGCSVYRSISYDNKERKITIDIFQAEPIIINVTGFNVLLIINDKIGVKTFTNIIKWMENGSSMRYNSLHFGSP